jgi:hypothetical protein
MRSGIGVLAVVTLAACVPPQPYTGAGAPQREWVRIVEINEQDSHYAERGVWEGQVCAVNQDWGKAEVAPTWYQAALECTNGRSDAFTMIRIEPSAPPGQYGNGGVPSPAPAPPPAPVAIGPGSTVKIMAISDWDPMTMYRARLVGKVCSVQGAVENGQTASHSRVVLSCGGQSIAFEDVMLAADPGPLSPAEGGSPTIVVVPTNPGGPAPTQPPPSQDWEPIQVKTFSQTSRPMAHGEVRVIVPKGWKIVGGGAFTGSSGDMANFLTASYPESQTVWVARSKDHFVAAPAPLTAFAIAIYDPSNRFDVRIFQARVNRSSTPSGSASVGKGYVLTGGGAVLDAVEPGNLLVASYPSADNSWAAMGKEHGATSQSAIGVYAIGVKALRGPAIEHIFVHETRKGGDSAAIDVQLPPPYMLTGGGAKTTQRGPGWLLTRSAPSGNGWGAAARAHIQPDGGAVEVWAIGLKTL